MTWESLGKGSRKKKTFQRKLIFAHKDIVCLGQEREFLSSLLQAPSIGSLSPFSNPVWMVFSPLSGGSLCHDNFWWPACRQDGHAAGSGPPSCTQVKGCSTMGKGIWSSAPEASSCGFSLPSWSLRGVSTSDALGEPHFPPGSRWTSSVAAACTPGQTSPSTSTLASTPPSRMSSVTPCTLGAGKPRPGGPAWPCREEPAS